MISDDWGNLEVRIKNEEVVKKRRLGPRIIND